jgi:hypothetical protein
MSTAHRLAAVAALVLTVPVLSACGGGSTVQQAASAVQSAASQAASAASSAASAAGESPSETPSSTDSSPSADDTAPAAGAASLCAAIDELKNMGDTPKTGDASALHKAAADIRDNAPAEVAEGAKAYSTIIELVATELEAGKLKATDGLSQAVAEGVGKDPKQITAFILYVTKNCKV